MPKLGPFPFVPNMEDCRKIVKTEGCTCYIMDTCCRNMTAADRTAADERILQIYVNHALKRGFPGPLERKAPGKQAVRQEGEDL